MNQTPAGQWLIADADKIGPNSEGGWIDIVEFTASTERGSISDLSHAADLYVEEFLEGFYIPDSDAFDEWSTLKREHFRRQALDALDELTNHHLEAGEYQLAESRARRQLKIDNFRESSWRQLMMALSESGRRNEALAEYEKCKQLLRDELKVKPAAETTALARTLRRSGESAISEEAVISDGPETSLTSPSLDEKTGEAFPLPSPYKGLYPFREEDASFFFGRESFTELLVSAVSDQSIVAVVGPSGSGKSSVVFAGLQAEIRQRTNWICASFRPGQRPSHALAAVLVPLLNKQLSETDRLIEADKLASAFLEKRVSLYECIRRIQEKNQVADRVLLIADQFEELFTLVPNDRLRHEFLDLLLELVFMQQYRVDPIFTLVITIRADFLSQALSYRPLADAIQDADVKLGSMTQSEMKRSITKPAMMKGVSFETGLVTRILDEVGQKQGNLPLLEFTLDQLWNRQEEGSLLHTSYEAIGRVQGALVRYADEVYEGLNSADQERAKRIMVQLVRPGEHTEDVRRLATREELGDDWQLVSHLADSRLVVTGRDGDGNETVEIVHEALISHWDRFQAWLDEGREFRLWQERMRAARQIWEVNAQDEGDLLRGRSLSAAQSWLRERPDEFNPDERDYIDRSIAHSQRRRQRVLLISGSVVVAALVLTIAALIQWRSAREARDEAIIKFAEQLAVQAVNLPEGSYGRALLLAVEAIKTADSAFTRQALEQLLLSNLHTHQTTRISLEQPFYAGGALSPDGRLGAFPARDRIHLWNVQTGRMLSATVQPPAGAFTAMGDFDPDGKWLAIGQPVTSIFDIQTGESRGDPINLPLPEVESLSISRDGEHLAAVDEGILAIADITTGEIVTTPTTSNASMEDASFLDVDFSPDGIYAAVGCDGSSLCLWDVISGKRSIKLDGIHSEPITAVSFSPNGELVGSASADGSVVIWDRSSREPVAASQSGHTSAVSAISFSHDNQRIASADEGGDVILWAIPDPESGTVLSKRLLGSTGNRTSWLAFSPDDEAVVTVMSENNAGTYPPSTDYLVKKWQRDARPGLPPAAVLQVQEGGVTDLAFLDDGSIRSVDADFFFREDGSLNFADPVADIRTWSVPAGQLVDDRGALPIGLNSTGATLSDNGHILAIGPHQGTVVLMDLTSTDMTTRTLEGPTQPVIGLDFTPNGRFLAAGSCHEGDLRVGTCSEGEAWVWDLETNNRIGPLVGSDSVIASLDLSSDANFLAAAGSKIHIWDLRSEMPEPEIVASAPGSGPDAFALVVLSPDNRWLAASQTTGPHLWRLNDQNLWERWDLEAGLENSLQLAFDPDSTMLAAGNFFGEIAIWDLDSGAIVARPGKQQNRGIFALTFSQDGSYLASGSLDGRLIVWNVDGLLEGIEAGPDYLIELACQVANRNFTQNEWQKYFGDEPYQITCPADGLSAAETPD